MPTGDTAGAHQDRVTARYGPVLVTLRGGALVVLRCELQSTRELRIESVPVDSLLVRWNAWKDLVNKLPRKRVLDLQSLPGP